MAQARGRRVLELALLYQMKKRDWAFVAACVAGALLFGVWSFQMGIAFHRSRQGATDLSSSHRRSLGGSQDGSSAGIPARPAADDSDQQARQPR
ncbi:hypothetical protein AAFG07_22275 [Bradyrhizobium sp. B097]|uniref:hypothetical protein n=1 Tax=Bradyrhizobium sp. B097 TaxID=3140244 RepID=UPI003183D21A